MTIANARAPVATHAQGTMPVSSRKSRPGDRRKENTKIGLKVDASKAVTSPLQAFSLTAWLIILRKRRSESLDLSSACRQPAKTVARLGLEKRAFVVGQA